ncbi:E3 ubiquitin/ISG15 ligase TRIM25-like [Hyperolius riggenbachi]|uniref:E3 ubiquitin/ISG15 ligase TRIM25-like n=1 Tax=Hyperolius riggenbachi TaxID=752182 RepID=UPI0035A2FAD0
MASADLREELGCPICLNIYTDPVMLKCGHNFCHLCIDGVLDSQEVSGSYFCPECRETFMERPESWKNFPLGNIARRFLSTHPDNEKSGVCCTYCLHSPVPAAKSCVMCEASLCERHLMVHSKSPEHVLCDPTATASLESRKCSVHQRILEYYCTEDSAWICVSCRLDGDHRGHQVKELDVKYEKEKKKSKHVLQKLISVIGNTQKRVQSQQDRRRKGQERGDIETERSPAQVRENLSGKEELKHTDYPGSTPSPTEDKVSFTEELSKTQRQPSLTKELKRLWALKLHIGSVQQTADQSEKTDLVLDLNTAGNNLHISEDRKTASMSDKMQNRPETPERFHYSQVLSSQSFSSGRHHWDVEVGESRTWRVGMCYPSIDRTGRYSGIGDNKRSWCLVRGCDLYSVVHDRRLILLTSDISSSRIRIYLDYEVGQISFYALCDPIRHLHTFTTTFTEPLHAAIGVWKGYVKISEVYRKTSTICPENTTKRGILFGL